MPLAGSESQALWRVLGAFSDDPKQTGRGWRVRCPAHPDDHPSLDVTTGADGRVLLICRSAGCSADDITRALGLTTADLFDRTSDGKRIRRHQIIDGAGKVIAIHYREGDGAGKRMEWQSGGKKGLNGLSPKDLPLYRLPDLLTAPDGSTVYVTEGEKAADALADHGLLAVSLVGGTGNLPSSDVLAPLKAHRPVLWPDSDPDGGGRLLMEKIAARLAVECQWLIWTAAPPKGDAFDYFEQGGMVEGLGEWLTTAPYKEETALATIDDVGWNLISSTDLARLDLPEPKWAVPGIVPEGVLLIAGKPKFGKSWWVLDLCVAVVLGGSAWGRISVEQGDALYVTYEDSYRRLQDRQQRSVGHALGIPGLDFVTNCPRSDEGGVELVMSWVRTHPKARLIVIDPLEHWRPVEDGKKQLYRQDYESLRPIVEMARSLGISVIIVHHCNKMVSPDDPFDAISGTTGLQGVADAIGVFRKEHGMADAVLFLKGKDVDYAELAFKSRVRDSFPAPAWELLGSGQEYRLSRERFETLEALWREPWQTPAMIAELMDPPTTKGAMRKRLFDMAHDGLVRVSDSKYSAGIDRDTYLQKYGHEKLSNADGVVRGNIVQRPYTPYTQNVSNARTPETPPVPTIPTNTTVPIATTVPTVPTVTEPTLKLTENANGSRPANQGANPPPGAEIPREHDRRAEADLPAQESHVEPELPHDSSGTDTRSNSTPGSEVASQTARRTWLRKCRDCDRIVEQMGSERCPACFEKWAVPEDEESPI